MGDGWVGGDEDGGQGLEILKGRRGREREDVERMVARAEGVDTAQVVIKLVTVQLKLWCISFQSF